MSNGGSLRIRIATRLPSVMTSASDVKSNQCFLSSNTVTARVRP